jgi:hypothetical protein
VHIDAPTPVSLEARRGTSYWDVVCRSPCDQPMPAGVEYRVSGPDVKPSESFVLNGTGRVTLTVDPSTQGSKAGGITLVVLGAVALAPGAGVTALIVGGELFGVILICPIAAAFAKDQNGEYGQCLGDIATYFGQAYASPYVWGPALASVPLMGGGIAWLVASNGHATNVTTTSASLRPDPLAPQPQWRTMEASLPPTTVIPLVQGRF